MQQQRMNTIVYIVVLWQYIFSQNYFFSKQFLQALPVFTFANQAGLDMLETTFIALQDITLEKIFDDHGRKNLCSEFPQIMQQVSHFVLTQSEYKTKNYNRYMMNQQKAGRIAVNCLHILLLGLYLCQRH